MDLATPALAELHTWHNQQNPLVRALTAPLIARVTETWTTMQAALDDQGQQQQALVAQLEAVRAEAAVQLSAVRAETVALAAEHQVVLQVTTDRIDQLERHLFGQKSERRPRTPDARREANQRRRAERTEAEKKAQRDAAAKARQKKLDALRTKIVVLPLGDEIAQGRPLPPRASVIYEWHRGELVRLLVHREQRVLPDGTIATASPLAQVIEGGSYGPALHARVAVRKCLDVMPLRRQERAFERGGAPLPVSVLCALFHRTATEIAPLYKAMVAYVGASAHVSADETPQPVLDEHQVRRGWMWVFATDEVLVYAYSPSRGGEVPQGVLGRSKGTLTVDGYTGYNLVTRGGRRERGGCWSHGRRGLFEARGYDESLVNGIRVWCKDRKTGATLHIGGEFTTGDCHEVVRRLRELARTGHLPLDGKYGEGVVAKICVVTDGLDWIADHVVPLYPNALVSLDPYHVVEQVADAARACLPKKRVKGVIAQARKALGVRDRRGRTQFRKGPRRLRHAVRGSGLSGSGQRLLDEVLLPLEGQVKRGKKRFKRLLAYVRRNLSRTDYGALRKRGVQIGSGAMESMHRTGSQVRMKRAGCRWTPQVATAILNLRMLGLSGRWKEYWDQPGLLGKMARESAA